MRSQSSLRAPPPETRPTSARDAELAEQLERVAQAERDAFERGAPERAAVVAERQPDERAAGIGIGVRRSLAREIGGELQALDARLPALGFGLERRRVGASDVSQPRERAGGAEHHAHRVPRAGHRVAEDVHARLLVGRVAPGARRRRRPRCRARPKRRPGEAMPTPSAAAAWSPAPPIAVDSNATAAATRAGSRAPRTPRPTSGGARRRRAAFPRRRRRRSRARRSVGGGRSPSAGGCAGSARILGLVPPQPEQLRRGEAGQRAVPGQLDQPFEPDRASISAHSAAVRWSFQRIAGRSTSSFGVQHDEPVHLAGEPDRALRAAARGSACGARHQSSGSCSAQPGCGVESG